MDLLDYARLAARAYSDVPTYGHEDSASRAVVYPEGIVGIPGTNNIACWLADLSAIADDVSGMGRLHLGFWEATKPLLPYLLKEAGITVLVGHSEGAALAQLLGVQLCLAGKPPRAIYAFEPPRLATDQIGGDVLRAHNVSVTLTRKGEDVVPMVPRLLEDWQHWFPLTELRPAALPFPNVEDHFIENVVKAIAAGGN